MKVTGHEYKKILHTLSQRVVAAQRDIRILNALKWSPEVKQNFFKKDCKEPPEVNAAMYEKIPLGFDPEAKTEEFYGIERDIRKQLGQFSGVGSIMQRICSEYSRVVDMLITRGTPRFTEISQSVKSRSGPPGPAAVIRCPGSGSELAAIVPQVGLRRC